MAGWCVIINHVQKVCVRLSKLLPPPIPNEGRPKTCVAERVHRLYDQSDPTPVVPRHQRSQKVMPFLSSNVRIQEFIIPSLQLIRILVDWSAIELFFYGVFFTPRGRAALAYLFQFGSAVSFFSTLSSLLSLITIWFVLVADVVVTGIGMCPGKNRRASAIKVGRNVDLGFRRAFCIHVRRGNSLRRGNGEA
jgi:hypothetical protein